MIGPTAAEAWEAHYWSCKRSRASLTFRQVAALFFGKHGYYPPEAIALMPVQLTDWFRYIRDVPMERLYTPGERHGPTTPTD